MAAINPSHQLVILARLGEYCRFRAGVHGSDEEPWTFMRRKLGETREALAGLKADLYAVTRRRLLEEVKAGGMTEDRCADFKVLFERLLRPGDFADLAIHLTTQGGKSQPSHAAVSRALDQLAPFTMFQDEDKPAEGRSPSCEKLIAELYKRLDFDRLGEILGRKPRTRRRKAYVLRRVRRNVAEYCSVLRIPTEASDTFTPFMLPRIEALLVANVRFLTRYR